MKPTQNILMIRPANFGFNEETAVSNFFQNKLTLTHQEVLNLAQLEFDGMVSTLRENGVEVFVIEDTATPIKPDAIFPNNWITTHKDGSIFLFPMQAVNRQHERRNDILSTLKKDFKVSRVVDLSHTESDKRYLEGTGSIVFDHKNKTAYACISPRTEQELFTYFCHEIGYRSISFTAQDALKKEIYHTNVMMCIGEKFGLICLESITNPIERDKVIQSFYENKKELIEISIQQMNSFAGNMLEVQSKDNHSILTLSASAFESLLPEQKERLKMHTKLVPINIPTIEKVGGGSVRCMMAEIYLPKKSWFKQ